MKFTIKPNGDSALRVAFKNEISEETNASVLALCRTVEDAAFRGIISCIPAYCTLLIEYDPLILNYQEAKQLVLSLKVDSLKQRCGRLVRIPTCYGGEYGPDLGEVAAQTGLTAEEVIRRHTASLCRVYMLGFRPGFPYLGGMDESIAVPRRKTPRTSIAAGSVGIAGKQTGIYPEASPGGWNIIGRTPLKLFSEKNRSLLQPGDMIQFCAVSSETYDLLVNDDSAVAEWTKYAENREFSTAREDDR